MTCFYQRSVPLYSGFFHLCTVMLLRTLLFLILNFCGLAIGGIFTQAVSEPWYLSLDKAPWTPPGWVFGAAWTLIMICFSVFLARAYTKYEETLRKEFILVFAGAWVLNVLWNPVFFYFQQITVGLFIISLLALFVFRFFQYGIRDMKWEWVLILPYLIWILIATSLNFYIVLYN